MAKLNYNIKMFTLYIYILFHKFYSVPKAETTDARPRRHVNR